MHRKRILSEPAMAEPIAGGAVDGRAKVGADDIDGVHMHNASSGKQSVGAVTAGKESLSLLVSSHDPVRGRSGGLALTYLGFSVIDWRLTTASLVWVVGERLPRRNQHVQILLRCIGDAFIAEGAPYGEVVFRHPLTKTYSFSRARDGLGFAYVTHNQSADRFYCHAFQAPSPEAALFVFEAWSNETRRLCGNMDILTAVPEDLRGILSFETGPKLEENRFNIKYLGNMPIAEAVVSSKLVDKVIDAAINKQQRQAPEQRQCRANSLPASQPQQVRTLPVRSSSVSDKSAAPHSRTAATRRNTVSTNGSEKQTSPEHNADSSQQAFVTDKAEKPVAPGQEGCDSGISMASTPESSDDSAGPGLPKGPASHDKTQTGEAKQQHLLKFKEIQLVLTAATIRLYDGTNTATLVWERKLASISHCCQGVNHGDCWCFVCQDGIDSSSFICCLFQCSDREESRTILEAFNKCFQVALELAKNPPILITSPYCESCPIYILHQLCQQLNTSTTTRVQQTHVHKAMEMLSKEDHNWVMARQQGVQNCSEEVQLQVMLGLLRAVYERQQKEHKHPEEAKPVQVDNSADAALSKPGKFGAFSRAKRSLASSFENLRKKDKEKPRASKLALDGKAKESPVMRQKSQDSPMRRASGPATIDGGQRTEVNEPSSLPLVTVDGVHVRGNTVSDSALIPPVSPTSFEVPPHTPTVTRRYMSQDDRKKSFRQSLYKTSQATPTATLSPRRSLSEDIELGIEETRSARHCIATPPCSDSTRALWKKAFDDCMFLIRMEKAAKIRREFDEATIQHLRNIRLSYDEALSRDESGRLTKVWTQLLEKLDRDRPTAVPPEIKATLLQGVPKHIRGRVWQALAQIRQREQKRRSEIFDQLLEDTSGKFEELSRQKTPFLHAIIIDLGRTFPGHQYFRKLTGPGQCSLYNVLRAYASLDEDVGYCQGLSFVAGLLIMHVETDQEAFGLLRSLMYSYELRSQYEPDMAKLPVRLYQLSRLLHDFRPQLHQLFEEQDVAPFFYAASWFLTLFASQFPIYFAARVMDFTFAEGIDAVFKLSLVLICYLEDQLLACSGFEQLLNTMKTGLPALAGRVPEIIVQEAMKMDIHEKLTAFEVEFAVLKDLDSTITSSADLEAANTALKAQNQELVQQLAMARGSALRLQEAVITLESERKQFVEKVDRLSSEKMRLEQAVEDLNNRLAQFESVAPDRGTNDRANTQTKTAGDMKKFQVHSRNKSLPEIIIREFNAQEKSLDDRVDEYAGLWSEPSMAGETNLASLSNGTDSELLAAMEYT